MFQTTTYFLAAKTLSDGSEVYATGGEYHDGSPRLTFDPRTAMQFPSGTKVPKGFRRRKLVIRTRLAGGGFYIESGPTGP